MFTLSGASAHAVDWAAFVANSDRTEDGLILDIMNGADFDTRVHICEALGLRTDPYAEDILSWLVARFSRSAEQETEVLLRVTMNSLFDEASSDQVLRDRIQANSLFIDELIKRMADFHDPMLRDSVIRLLPHVADGNRLSALMGVGAGIESSLRQGSISAAETALAYEYLTVVQQIGTPDFLESCLAIARLSWSKDLTEKAHQVARVLASTAR